MIEIVEEPSSETNFSQGDPCLMHTNCQKSVDNKRNSTNVPCEAIGQLLVDHFHQIFGPIYQKSK